MSIFALFASGNFVYEVGLDRHPDWLSPAVLRGEKNVLNDDLTIYDTGPLPVDGPNTVFEVDGEKVFGRDLVGRDLGGSEWRVRYIRVATDGSREDAARICHENEELFALEVPPAFNPLDIGEVDGGWEDDHGQWDLVLVRL
ncbi:hypothetical protein KIH74_14795 [Kineosporia sp. J2-2]|uniref:Uncharacterized protein n=1 Tax=Kineosporia corallincola TaxID=2835133 RepID=A0ABS5TGI0_9ACTN|nr:hypothetical protein [Kineosporia corallincola]MBT0770206.1 hypothetical protein [Kineosporia corallincola]